MGSKVYLYKSNDVWLLKWLTLLKAHPWFWKGIRLVALLDISPMVRRTIVSYRKNNWSIRCGWERHVENINRSSESNYRRGAQRKEKNWRRRIANSVIIEEVKGTRAIGWGSTIATKHTIAMSALKYAMRIGDYSMSVVCKEDRRAKEEINNEFNWWKAKGRWSLRRSRGTIIRGNRSYQHCWWKIRSMSLDWPNLLCYIDVCRSIVGRQCRGWMIWQDASEDNMKS